MSQNKPLIVLFSFTISGCGALGYGEPDCGSSSAKQLIEEIASENEVDQSNLWATRSRQMSRELGSTPLEQTDEFKRYREEIEQLNGRIESLRDQCLAINIPEMFNWVRNNTRVRDAVRYQWEHDKHFEPYDTPDFEEYLDNSVRNNDYIRWTGIYRYNPGSLENTRRDLCMAGGFAERFRIQVLEDEVRSELSLSYGGYPHPLFSIVEFHENQLLPLVQSRGDLEEELSEFQNAYQDEIDQAVRTSWLDAKKLLRYDLSNIITKQINPDTGSVVCEATLGLTMPEWGATERRIRYTIEKNSDGDLYANAWFD